MSEATEIPIETGQPQTRTERTRSLEDAEKYKALETLKDLGLLTPINQLGTFHGRVGKKDDAPWEVDPTFAIHGNTTGNLNVNERSTLYSSDADIADEFAHARGSEIVQSFYIEQFMEKVRNYTPEERREWLDGINRKEREYWESLTPDQRRYSPNQNPRVYTEDYLEHPYIIQREATTLEEKLSQEEKDDAWNKAAQAFRAEIHEIITSDSDATVIDLSFSLSKLNEEDQAKYRKALETIAIPITEGSPVDFKAQDAIESFAKVLTTLQKNFILSKEVPEIADMAGIDEEVTLQLASAYNARQFAVSRPTYLADRLLRYPSDIFTDNFTIKEGKEEAPINLEYAQRFMREAHIIAAKQPIDSATLGKSITSVSFFDLEKIGTRDQIDSQKNAIQLKMGGLIDRFPDLPKPSTENTRELLEILADAHVKPERLVAAAKLVDGYEAIFNADAGNWEGFTLAEHTETVIRNFDENFADIIPVDFLTSMRLALLVHDIGKSTAASRGEKHRQKEYNAIQAADFLNKLGVDNNYRDLILAIIGEGANLAFQCQLKPGDESVFNKMEAFAKDAVGEYLGSSDADKFQSEAFTEMCKILQLCDGGAYTSMAITRRDGKGRFRNAPSFNDSFSAPIGVGKRDIRYKE